MTLTKKHDVIFAILVSAPLFIISMVFGDALYIGAWYYVVVPLVAFGIAAMFKPAPLYQFGCAIAIAIAFLMYLRINWFSSSPEGLIGLGHLFSLPGAMFGIIISAFLLKGKFDNPTSLIGFIFGFIGFGLGFAVNQMINCQTLIYCGAFSIFYYM